MMLLQPILPLKLIPIENRNTWEIQKGWYLIHIVAIMDLTKRIQTGWFYHHSLPLCMPNILLHRINRVYKFCKIKYEILTEHLHTTHKKKLKRLAKHDDLAHHLIALNISPFFLWISHSCFHHTWKGNKMIINGEK